MGAGIKDPKIQGQLKELETDTAQAGVELDKALVDSAIDLAGIVDPTPISDAISLARSAAGGDWISAGLSVVSMLPYAGDAIAKPIKGAKITEKILNLKKRIADNAVKARQVVVNSLKKDAAIIRAERAKKKGEEISKELTQLCPMEANRYGTHTPKKGWKQGGERGNGPWDPKESDLKPDKIQDIESVTKGKPVQFKDGYPDFSEYIYKTEGVNGKSIPGEVEIQLSKTGVREEDFKLADKAMAEKLGTDKFKRPKGWTWHHTEDGTTMQLVPSNLHNNVPHSGGVSLAKDPGY
ncbi:HNH endonuclease [Methylobacter sp. YRD-M1]|uniref:HNH endonuclease n=1 Tax=Methylobacter sp. YRD-M1 TaxID=2911520 RepID=UPI00227CE324|nr:HNH endonuclease [Methylobacter sp. YRD-M1]WAK03796.1 HNH endonuclease [Methylobacter sp. YRD-M1]